jgi:Spy/CpxP family protein refolding chaperone
VKRILLLFWLVATIAAAQPPRASFPWWDSPIARDLNLTADQQQQIRSIIREHRGRLVDLRGAVEKAEGELEDIFNEEQVDQRRSNEAIDRLASARADLTRVLSQMSLRLRGVLTTEQWRELQKRQPLRPRMLRQGGRGGGPARRPPEPPNQP